MSAVIKVDTWWLQGKAMDYAVAQAVANNDKAVAVAVRTAKKVAATARKNLLAGESLSRKKSKTNSARTGGKGKPSSISSKNMPPLSGYRQAVAKEIHYKDLQTKKRKAVAPGSDIPVALAVADHWASEAFEYGNGPDLAMSRYMAAAARAAAGGAVTVRYIR